MQKLNFIDMELIRRMNYHGWTLVEGCFYLPYTDIKKTPKEAEEWLKQLEKK